MGALAIRAPFHAGRDRRGDRGDPVVAIHRPEQRQRCRLWPDRRAELGLRCGSPGAPVAARRWGDVRLWYGHPRTLDAVGMVLLIALPIRRTVTPRVRRG